MMKLKLKGYFHRNLARPIYGLLRTFQPILNLKKRTFFDKFKVKTRDGITFWLFNNAFYWETEMFWAGFENFDYEITSRRIWCALAVESKVVLDIGSNSGWFSVMAKAYNSKAIVFAFEPQPNVFRVLEKNNRINKFDIFCNNIALSDKKGKSSFYNTGSNTFTTENTNHGSLNKEWRKDNQHSIQVNVDRLDNFIADHDITRVDLIKIDVETLEFEVLKGYGNFYRKHKPIILLEVQDLDLGAKINELFIGLHCMFFHVIESEGITEVPVLGIQSSSRNRNYIICPKDKVGLISEFII